MARKIVSAVILIPLALLIVALAVANREIVGLSFDPFNPAAPAFALRLPLFILLFVLLIVGVIVGGIAAWLRQAKWRRTARRLDAELRAARSEVDRLRRQLADAERSAAPPPLSLRPPAA
jgi:uncharacterized integral membrane protein